MQADEKVNILLVDDLPEKLLTLTTILEDLGENLIQVRSGREALRRLLEQDFAVILLDINMPDMDGFETAAMIRQHRRCANTPIIFITAFADEMLTIQGYSLGAVDYIMSPVVPQVLRTKVKVFVELFRKTEQVKQHAEQRVALAREQAAREAAELANRRKDEFLAMLSHELRNPLAPIRNALHIFHLKHLEDPQLVEARSVLERQVQQLTSIVDELLDVFRITYGKLALQQETFDLGELVRQTAEDHRAELERDRRLFSMELPEAPVWVTGDRTRLAQVLSNLLHNATKFTKPGDSVRVRLRADETNGRALVAVEDTGVGIEAHVLPAVFDTFAQADQGLDRRQGGLGLGLALVKGLVQMHGGDVQAVSGGRGRGAELSFWLPLSCAPTMEEPAAPPPAAPSRRLRVLIVEDHRDTAQTLAMLLRHFGHEVELAHTGIDGVAAARTWQPDVVLCDLGLPKMNGFEVASTLRADPATALIHLVAISGYGQKEDRERSANAGFDQHFTKPVDPAQIQNCLASLAINFSP